MDNGNTRPAPEQSTGPASGVGGSPELGNNSPERGNNSPERGGNSPERGDNSFVPGTDFEPIAPAPVTLTAAPPPDSDNNRSWFQTYRNPLLGLAALLVLLLVVIFILPKAVQPVDREKVAEAVKPANPAGKIESPWRDAQLAKERREAQEILSQLLKLQKGLEEKSVERWAPDLYQKALDTAGAADTNYRQREFNQAQTQYRDALTQFEALDAKADTVLQDKLQQGADALVNGEADTALDAFDLALAIDPKHEAGLQGRARAEVLEQVLELLRKGELLQKTQFLEQAQQSYQQALTLDPSSPPASAKVAEIKQAILERDFTEAMSAGYTALNQNQYNQATKAFRKAQSLKPGAPEVQTALAQTSNQKTQAQIRQLLDTAQREEQREAWQASADAFNQALALDASLVPARIGQIRTQARAGLDQKLENTLAQPERLATEAVYRDAQKLLADAKALKNPGPRLQKQIQSLARLLQIAITPVAIQLQSDNQTDITLYRVGHLGYFLSRDIKLKPGRYTAVGTRDGYRDVRREFTVSADNPQQAIVIQCVEKIALDG